MLNLFVHEHPLMLRWLALAVIVRLIVGAFNIGIK